jgi:hypothetical protein
MNKNFQEGEDFLRRYMNPEMREESPESLSSKVMSRIQLEPVIRKAHDRSGKRLAVPVISSIIAFALIIAALLFTKEGSIVQIPALDLLKDITFYMPDLGFEELPFLSIPKVVTCLVIGLIALSVFDKILYTLFNRKHK